MLHFLISHVIPEVFHIFMPQFSPFYFINLISWALCILSFVTWFHQSISLPSILRVQLSRAFILFNF